MHLIQGRGDMQRSETPRPPSKSFLVTLFPIQRWSCTVQDSKFSGPSCAFTPRLQHEFNPCFSSWWSKLSHFLWVCHLSFASLLLWPTLPRGVRKECEKAVGRHATKHHQSRGESFWPTLYGFFWLTFYLRDEFIRWDRRRIIWSTNNYTITPMKIYHYVQTTHEAKDRWLHICLSPHINVTCVHVDMLKISINIQVKEENVAELFVSLCKERNNFVNLLSSEKSAECGLNRIN